MSEDSIRLRKYFLGTLSFEEGEEIEQRIIAEPEFEADVFAAEHDLIEDHLDGVLSSDENRQFNDNYLITPGRRENIRVVIALRELSTKNAEKEIPHKTFTKEGGLSFERLRIMFIARPAMVYGVPLLFLIFAIVAYLWLDRDRQSRGFHDVYAALNQQDFGDLERYKRYPGVSILPGSLRGTGSIVKIGDASPGDAVLVRLVLPIEFKPYSRFNFRLAKGRNELLAFDSLRPYDSEGGLELRLLLPTDLLQKGAYQADVAASDNANMSVNYDFTVE